MTDNKLPFLPAALKAAESLKLRVSASQGHRGQVTNIEATWPDLCDKLSQTKWDNVTLPEYLELPQAEQHKRKNRGYFVGGQFIGGIRKISNMDERSVLTFDIDNCPLDLLEELTDPLAGYLAGFEYFLYSTRKHTPEAPRVRVVIPMTKAVPLSQFGALCRIISHGIDPTMRAVDPVSFRPPQAMFWPTTCREAQFLHKRHRGRLLDAQEVLDSWGDWTDYARLPASPREGELRPAQEHAADPTGKNGLVGAFCRAYDIHEAIARFLPTIYLAGELGPDGAVARYTFASGSTANGAVVYDDGRFLYSWHTTDPCADRLVNSFDLVRLHLFADRDKKHERGEEGEDDNYDSPALKRSFQSMRHMLADDPAVCTEAMAGRYEWDEEDAEAAFAEAEEAASPPPAAEGPGKAAPEWVSDLAITPRGKITACLPNLVLVLRNDARFAGAIGYNQFKQEAALVRPIRAKRLRVGTGPLSDPSGDPVGGRAETTIRSVLEARAGKGARGYGLAVTDRDLRDAMSVVARDLPYHPVRDYLRALAWDRVPRLRRMWAAYFHAADTAYHGEVGYNWMVAAVLRVMEPGAKFDFVPILQGRQGIMKSSAARVLAGDAWFGELSAISDDKRLLVEAMQGKWIIEIPDLVQFNKADNELLKAMFSARSDRVRLAWARSAEEYHRQCVFIGTTNQAEFLKDPTGNRRFWPVGLGNREVDIEALRRDRDQLWAEAFTEYLCLRLDTPDGQPLPLYMRTKLLREAAEGEQSARAVTDPDQMLAWQIEAWLEQPVPEAEAKVGFRGDVIEDHDGEPTVLRATTCIPDIILHVLGQDDRKADRRLALDVGRALSRLPGWAKRPQAGWVGGRIGVAKVWDRTAKT